MLFNKLIGFEHSFTSATPAFQAKDVQKYLGAGQLMHLPQRICAATKYLDRFEYVHTLDGRPDRSIAVSLFAFATAASICRTDPASTTTS